MYIFIDMVVVVNIQDTIERFLREESCARGHNMSWTKHEREIPQQMDFTSCGVFICGHAYLLVGVLCQWMGNKYVVYMLHAYYMSANTLITIVNLVNIWVIVALKRLQTRCLTEDNAREAAQLFMQSDVNDMRRRMLVQVTCMLSNHFVMF